MLTVLVGATGLLTFFFLHSLEKGFDSSFRDACLAPPNHGAFPVQPVRPLRKHSLHGSVNESRRRADQYGRVSFY